MVALALLVACDAWEKVVSSPNPLACVTHRLATGQPTSVALLGTSVSAGRGSERGCTKPAGCGLRSQLPTTLAQRFPRAQLSFDVRVARVRRDVAHVSGGLHRTAATDARRPVRAPDGAVDSDHERAQQLAVRAWHARATQK